MNRTLFVVPLCFVSLALPSSAALQFLSTVNSGVSTKLVGTAYDGNSTFVAVATNASVSRGVFASDHIQFGGNTVPGSPSLLSATYGSGKFLVGGVNNVAFTSANGTNWSASSPPFQNAAAVTGLAFNPNAGGGRFVAVASVVETYYAGSSLSWASANLTNASFLESFLGVTALGGSRFASCGVFGDIRISADGVGWVNPAGHALDTAQPNLLGIASDGGNRLVTVGAGGKILYSGNGGTSWSSATSPAGSTTLNGVGYDTSQGIFLAVGNNGTVISSANGGASWTSLNAGFSGNLNSVIFANAGNLRGVGLLVGDGGKAIVAGVAPQAPTTNSTSSKTNCANVLPNPPLEATPVITADNWLVTVDWYATSTGGSPLSGGVGTTSFVPPNTSAPPNAPGFYTYYAQARDLRTGFVSPTRTPVTLTLNPRPTSTLISLDVTNCDYGAPYVVQAALTGLSPWYVTWWDGAVSNVVSGPATRTVFPTNSFGSSVPAIFNFWVAAVSNADSCIGNQAGDITGTNIVRINPRPTAVASGTNTICNGQSTVVQAALTGLGPWTVVWASNGIPVLTTNYGVSPGDVVVTPSNPNLNAAANVLYTVAALMDVSSGCTNNLAGDLAGGALIHVNPRPTATVSGTNAICNGQSTVVQAALTGLGPWTVVWASNGIPVVTTNYAASPGGLVVSPSNSNLNGFTNALYTVVALTDSSSGCTNTLAGDLRGGALIRVNPRPTAVVSGTNTICNGQSTVVQAALTGLGPWTVVWASNGIPVLTTNYGASPGAFVVSPSNSDLNGFTNALYTVAGLTDSTSGCTNNLAQDLTGGALIRVNPRPTAAVSGTNIICNGQSTVVQAALTGLGPWTVVWASNGIPVLTTNYGASPGALVVSPSNSNLNGFTNAFYTVAALTDTTSGCTNNLSGDLTGGALIRVNPRPTAAVSGTNIICNGQSTVVQAALTGLGPWTVVWASNGIPVLTTNYGASPGAVVVSPSNRNLNGFTNVLYTVAALTDTTSGCTNNLLGDLTGGALIRVNPRPTAAVSGTNIVCNGQSTVVQAALTGLGPWTVVWASNGIPLLTTNYGASPGSLMVSPSNSNLNGFTNVLYTVVVLTDTSSGCTNNLSGDLTGGALIRVNPRPTAAVSGTNTICNGQSTVVQAALTGFGPWTVVWASNGIPMLTTNYGASPGSLVVSPSNSNLNGFTNVLYSVAALTDTSSGCTNNLPTDLTGGALIRVNPRPTSTLSSQNVTNCDNGAPYTVQAALTGLSPWYVTWWDGAVSNVVSSPATRIVFPTNTVGSSVPVIYTYWVGAVSNADTCAGNLAGDISGTNTVRINPNLVVSTGPSDQVACPGSNAIFSVSATGLGLIYQWFHTNSPLANQTNSTLALSNVGPGAAGLYSVTVSSTLCGNPVTSNATLTVLQSIFLTNAPVDQTACAGDSALFAVVAGGPGLTYQWYYLTNNLLANETNSTLLLTNVSLGMAGAYSVVIGGTCGLPVTNYASLTVYGRPTANVYNGTPFTICPNTQPWSVYATLSGAGPWTVVWSDGLVETNVVSGAPHQRVVAPSVTTIYSVTNLSDIHCTSTSPSQLTGSAQVTVYPMPGAPFFIANQTNCASITNPPLSVTAVGGTTIDWYDAPSGGNLVTNNSAVFIPTNISVGAHTYYAQAKDNATLCVNTNRTAVTLQLQDCVGTLAIRPAAADEVLISWLGNMNLQSAIGLTNPPPVNWWSFVSAGTAGASNAVTVPLTNSQQFFRLQGPAQ